MLILGAVGVALSCIGFISALKAALAIPKAASGSISTAVTTKPPKIGRGERVFWSGGDEAYLAAEQYAIKTGGTTLEMTPIGQHLTQLTKEIGYTATKDMWKEASLQFAKSAIKNQRIANVFIKKSVYRGAKNIWEMVERPILEKTRIIIVLNFL